MNALASRWIPVVEAALRTAFGEPRTLGPSAWSVRLPDGPVPELTVSLDGGWLTAAGPVAKSGGAIDYAGVARENLSLPPLLKRIDALRADLPLATPQAVEIAIGRLAGDLRALGEAGAEPAGVQPDLPGSETTTDYDLGEACAEAGWDSTPRGDGTLGIELDCRRGLHLAEAAGNAGAVRLAVELLKLGRSAACGLKAAAYVLCRVAGGLRMVRPFLHTAAAESALGLEVLLPATPPPAYLHEALSALSVAVDHCGPELQTFTDEDFAGDFLAITEPAGGNRPEPNHKTRKEKQEP